MHAEQINLQAARQLIQLLHSNPSSSVSQVGKQDIYFWSSINSVPFQLVEQHNLLQICDLSTIEAYCQQAIANQPKAVQQYQKGKAKALFAIAGEVVKLSSQKANMKIVVECLEKLLKKKQ